MAMKQRGAVPPWQRGERPAVRHWPGG